MVTIQIHISDETAAAIEEWIPIHEKSSAVLRAEIALAVAQHPDSCTDASCPEIRRIEAANKLLSQLEAVSRFSHDVLGAAKCAKASA